VQDLCERANVGRSTFYSHFPNKDALLLGGLEDLRGELARQAVARSRAAGSRAAAHGFGFSLGLIEHAHEQRKVFRGMIGRRSGFIVQQRFREMVTRLVSDELPATTGKLPRAAAARALAAAFVELLAWWVEQRSPMPPAELAVLFDELSQPFVGRAST
jgi:AcrR family transcriptional regulator